ncbi:MAG: aldehyde dehydrogenase family protein, partial [Myxococcales bacterium]|nr:aldehyde dehydrogenase family protein [Myxococcales bacterium]
MAAKTQRASVAEKSSATRGSSTSSRASAQKPPKSSRRPKTSRAQASAPSTSSAIVRAYPTTNGHAKSNEHGLAFGSAWTYAPAPESADHVQIQKRYELFIGGKWQKPLSGKYFDTVSPSTEEKLAEIAEADERDVDRAVQAAREAFDRYWAPMRPIDRAKYIYRIARQLQEKAREMAIVESMDGGKPIKESRDVDIPLAANHFFYYAGWADKLQYAFPGTKVRPLGVAGQVIPWNFPLLMAAWKIAPALACGNTVVLKPAETTPLTALLLAKICEEADLPP